MIESIIERYNLAPATYQRSTFEESNVLNSYLNIKWADNIKEGWYGWDIGNAPIKWYLAVSDFLDLAVKKCPQLEILQIKQKFGGLRIYINNADAEVYEAASRLEYLCQMENLYE